MRVPGAGLQGDGAQATSDADRLVVHDDAQCGVRGFAQPAAASEASRAVAPIRRIFMRFSWNGRQERNFLAVTNLKSLFVNSRSSVPDLPAKRQQAFTSVDRQLLKSW